MKWVVIEREGFGFQESPIEEVFREEFKTEQEAKDFLDSYRKDKNLSWASLETPFTYKIIWVQDSIKEY